MPYVEGGHNDKIFPWKGSEKNTSDKYEDSTLKYPYGNVKKYKYISVIIIVCSCSCSG